MFWIVLPIALAMLVLGYRRLQNVGETRKAPIDSLSVVLSAFGFGGLVYGLSRIGETPAAGEDAAMAAMPMWISLGVGVVSLAAFIIRQLLAAATRPRPARPARVPLVDLHLLGRS